MRQFLKFTLASFLGSLTAMIIAGLFAFIILLGMISLLSVEEEVTVNSNSILEIKLNYEIPERAEFKAVPDFINMIPKISRKPGLDDLIKSIKAAGNDERIKGIYLNLNGAVIGSYSNVEALIRALQDFKQSGKPILAYGSTISQKAFYLSSIADKLFIAPEGIIEWKGLSVELTFFKKAFDKLGIEAQIFKAGKYKSAVEPFELTSMSKESKAQLKSLIDNTYENMLINISGAKGVAKDDLKKYADNMELINPQTAYEAKLVDSLIYPAEFSELLKSKFGSKFSKIGISKYSKTVNESYSKNRIAVIYADGTILQGEGNDNGIITDEALSAEIRKATNNDKIKAIVLRVNSPGGDALASDLIWNEIEEAKKKKPVIASFGSVAASGGYYIACAADTIVSEPTCVTGSIGVFGFIPNIEKFMDEKLGITFDRVKTSPHADMFTIAKPFSSEERKIIQKQIDRVYDTFLSRVAAGRGKSIEEVHKLAQGRIYTGIEAKEIGLVDELGGLDKAIEIAAAKAGLDNYSTVKYPVLKKPFEELLKIFSEKVKSHFVDNELGINKKYYNQIKNLAQLNGVQTLLPVSIEID
ncbi:MAG: signal peptide peptidase SppA [Bacteroidetes bacterium]|nr:signal peptide peptidase SppA [Bacteroidota bacterium]MBU1680588.1 signal peptide peptidase SppA [Bacteroidota bacterium]